MNGVVAIRNMSLLSSSKTVSELFGGVLRVMIARTRNDFDRKLVAMRVYLERERERGKETRRLILQRGGNILLFGIYFR